MANTNLAQHEQLLKLLEKSIREISERQNDVYDTFHKTLNVFNATRNETMRLFVVADDLRTTRLNFEKENTEKDSVGQQVRTWWKKW